MNIMHTNLDKSKKLVKMSHDKEKRYAAKEIKIRTKRIGRSIFLVTKRKEHC